MKKIKLSLVSLLAGVMFAGIAVQASAQEPTHTIKIDSVKVSVEGDSLQVRMRIEASDLHIPTRHWMRLQFVIEGKTQSYYLPEVLYTGGQRLLYEKRGRRLAGDDTPLTPMIVKKVKSDQTYTLDYIHAVPYQEWMGEASLAYTRILYGCAEDYSVPGGVLLTELIEVQPVQERKPDPRHFASLVSFLTPEVEEIKAREASVALNIDFPRGVYEVRPLFGRNAAELFKVDTLMESITGNALINLEKIEITGYASPEGSYKSNDVLSRRRSEGFRSYMLSKYKLHGTPMEAHWVAEDWAHLEKMLLEVSESDFPQKFVVLNIIRDEANAPDAKERILKQIDNGRLFARLLEEYFPTLRRIELTADYTVSKVPVEQARELIHTRPDLLSQNEIFRVASICEPGSEEYREVYRIAARRYPSDVIANNNAAAAYLQTGDTASAAPYLEKIKSDPRSLINQGAYYYILGEIEQAENFFRLARQAGNEQGRANLELISQ